MTDHTPYTPDLERVRKQWAYGQSGDRVHRTQEYLDQFDRFIAQVKRDAAREALDGLAEHIDWTASQFLGIRVGSQKAQDVRDYRDTNYPKETP